MRNSNACSHWNSHAWTHARLKQQMWWVISAACSSLNGFLSDWVDYIMASHTLNYRHTLLLLQPTSGEKRKGRQEAEGGTWWGQKTPYLVIHAFILTRHLFLSCFVTSTVKCLETLLFWQLVLDFWHPLYPHFPLFFFSIWSHSQKKFNLWPLRLNFVCYLFILWQESGVIDFSKAEL